MPDLNQFGIRLLQCVYIRVCWWSVPLVIPEFTSTPTSLSTERSRVIDVVADVAHASVSLSRPSPSSDNSFRYRSSYNEQRLTPINSLYKLQRHRHLPWRDSQPDLATCPCVTASYSVVWSTLLMITLTIIRVNRISGMLHSRVYHLVILFKLNNKQ